MNYPNRTGKVLHNLTIVFMFLFFLVIISCSKDDDFGEVYGGGKDYSQGNGVFVVNEGNFGHGNASLSYLNIDSLKMEQNIFSSVNGRPLGDVAHSMQIINNEAWIVVNNSARIQVASLADMQSVNTITGLTSPRFILPVSGNKAYVSDFYDSKISVLDLENKKILRSIDLGRSSEQMIMAGDFVFVAFWSNYAFPAKVNNQLMVISKTSGQLIDSITVGREPNSMVADKNGKLWVLCSGGFMNEEKPSLWCIDPENMQVEKTFHFPETHSSPSAMCRNADRDTLFFLNNGVFSMPVDSDALPENPLIEETEGLFYALGIHPESSQIYLSDAVDYQQRGLVFRYSADGHLIDSYRAGIIPGKFVFD